MVGCNANAFPVFDKATIDSAEASIHQDLKDLSELKFSTLTPRYKGTFGNELNGRLAALFVYERIKQFQLNDLKVAYGDAQRIASCRSGTLILYPAYFKASKVERWQTLIHESQHCGGSSLEDLHFHKLCPYPFEFSILDKRYRLKSQSLALKYACDEEPSGAYFIAGTFLGQLISSCLNCSQEMREQAFVSFVTQNLVRITSPKVADDLLMNGLNRYRDYVPLIFQLLSEL